MDKPTIWVVEISYSRGDWQPTVVAEIDADSGGMRKREMERQAALLHPDEKERPKYRVKQYQRKDNGKSE